MASDLLTPEELGERWHVACETLRYWRWNGTGAPYVKINGCILYRLDDVDQFEKEHVRRHTADKVLVNGVEGKVGKNPVSH
ncbi:MAG: DNA-binding protein [Alphaproteobacteria bacterium]|nr:DNA-binding protein [Alphaproteobacteria bacterium]